METLLFPLLLFAVMYFLLIRPQKQRVAAQRAVVESLTIGDEVVTIGGLIGRITELDGDAVTIETTPGTRLRFRRSAVSGKFTDATPESGEETGG